MTFQDLPTDWATRPLTDPALAGDVLDLVVRDDDRRTGGLAVLLCGPDHRLQQPVMVAMDGPASLADKRLAVQRFLEAVDHGLGESLLLAVVRERGAFVTDDDREWHEVALRGCREAGVTLLGLWVVTRHVVREVRVPGEERRPA